MTDECVSRKCINYIFVIFKKNLPWDFLREIIETIYLGRGNFSSEDFKRWLNFELWRWISFIFLFFFLLSCNFSFLFVCLFFVVLFFPLSNSIRYFTWMSPFLNVTARRYIHSKGIIYSPLWKTLLSRQEENSWYVEASHFFAQRREPQLH